MQKKSCRLSYAPLQAAQEKLEAWAAWEQAQQVEVHPFDPQSVAELVGLLARQAVAELVELLAQQAVIPQR